MRLDEPIDQIIQHIHGLDRDGCLTELASIRRPRLDFTEDFLHQLSLEQLRHVLMAACLQARRHVRRQGPPGRRRAG